MPFFIFETPPRWLAGADPEHTPEHTPASHDGNAAVFLTGQNCPFGHFF
jgi:hypothetical protein